MYQSFIWTRNNQIASKKTPYLLCYKKVKNKDDLNRKSRSDYNQSSLEKHKKGI